jgi:hypothetical protein
MEKNMLLQHLYVFENFKGSNKLNIKVIYKIIFLQNNSFSIYLDCHFISATLRYIKDLAGTFGNDCVFYLVQDNKASIRIGRPAARGHSPLIMRLDYQISTTNSTSIPPTVRHQLKPMYVLNTRLNSKEEIRHHYGLITRANPIGSELVTQLSFFFNF